MVLEAVEQTKAAARSGDSKATTARYTAAKLSRKDQLKKRQKEASVFSELFSMAVGTHPFTRGASSKNTSSHAKRPRLATSVKLEDVEHDDGDEDGGGCSASLHSPRPRRSLRIAAARGTQPSK